MTVEWVEDDAAYCVWFENNKHYGQKFRLTSLAHEGE
jgi:hypothetical protein